MKVFTVFSSFMMLFTKTIFLPSYYAKGLVITNGPQNTTVCMNAMAECTCGFTGANPNAVVPDWNIIFRNDSGNITSNDIIDGEDIMNRLINDLQWVPDLTSGDNNATNSKLLVGPVNMTHNQSSYQCIITVSLNGLKSVISSVGTMTVVDPPSVIIIVEEICTTSISISLNTHSHPSCGEVSHNVTISGNVVYPDTVGGSQYTIDALQSDTLYNITVTSTHSGSIRILNKDVRTIIPVSPNPIDVDSIEIKQLHNKNIIMWKPPENDTCSMLAIHYDVRINSSKGEMLSEEVYSTTVVFDHLDNHLTITYTVNITVVDIKGLRSIPTVTEMTINKISSAGPGDSSPPNENTQSDDNALAVIVIIVVVVVAIGIVVMIIIIISYVKYHHHHKRINLNSKRETEDNCYVGTQDENKSLEIASPYAVSGPTPAWSTNSTHSNTHEPSVDNDHVDESVHNDEDESTPPLPARLNYAELQLTNGVPKIMDLDKHVVYTETKPA